MKATAKVYLNRYSKNKDGECPLSILVTFQRERHKYSLGCSISTEDFNKPKNREQKEKVSFARSMLAKATTIIDGLMDAFLFETFEKKFLTSAATAGALSEAFDNYISDIESERVGTISAYSDAKQSFGNFRKSAKIRDVTVKWLKDYESWMDTRGRSKTTVGMHTRSLRALFNRAIAKGEIPADRYPFGRGKYQPPTGKNKKKALVLSEINLIFSAKLTPGSTAEKMRDYWVFLYLCNGINVADFCALKKSNLNEDCITFIRAKTQRTKRDVETIKIPLLDKAKEIITRHGTVSVGVKDYFLFPHFNEGLTPIERKKVVQNLTRLINDYVKEIAANAGIKKTVTTYSARHSFATILKNSGAPVAMISQMLGHSSITTTQNYLASFEDDQLKKATAALVNFGGQKAL